MIFFLAQALDPKVTVTSHVLVPVRRFPPHGTGLFDIASLGEGWRRGRVSEDDELTIDLTNVKFIEHETMVLIFALVCDWKTRKKAVYLDLPTSTRVLNYLRAWQFPAAIENALNLRFAEVLTEDSQIRYEQLKKLPNDYEQVVVSPDGGRASLVHISFFELQALQISRAVFDLEDVVRRAATLAKDKWLDAHVLGILDNYLAQKNYGDRVATNVVYEAVRNSALHPKATLAYASSQIRREDLGKGADGKQRWGDPIWIEVSIWDDGESILDTLKLALGDNQPITSSSYGLDDETFVVEVHDEGGPSRSFLRTVGDLHSDSDIAIMASAFMLGVSSQPHRSPDETYSESHPSGTDLKTRVRGLPGAGLYVLRTTVIDDFKGSIQYLTGRHRLSISGTPEVGKYLFSVSSGGPDDMTVKGNLLIVRIPLSRQATSTGDDA
ncbi:hypothetical protein BH11ACT5_BH11ACT5_07800 [soil metagenome]